MSSILDIINEDIAKEANTEDKDVITSIKNKLTKNGHTTLTMYHGSNKFIGDKFDSKHIGTSSGTSDEKGVGFYFTSDYAGAEHYAGSTDEGVVLTVEIKVDNTHQVENFTSPKRHKKFIEYAIKNSSNVLDVLSNYSDTAPQIPFYNVDDGGFTDKISGEFVACSSEEYIKKHGGLRRIFNSAHSKNGYDTLLDFVMLQDNMYEALAIVESELYSAHNYEDDNKSKMESISNGIKLQNIKAEYGFKMSLHPNADGSIVAVVYDTSVLTVKNKEKPTQKIERSKSAFKI
ncbi:hypothetical protein [Photobacterium kishitanii]|uniref:ART-PolyVal-like domain-containing protein n=1 Tax=Photobacterium kishitanii TaxID=318456 RepID=A0A2T3KM63_9GAMM|nr:hypothetical protein [Photobacterium kishitanii]PSV00886.1 hypothetical protein C9J27_02335 [Photobacterium kishitanii]